MSEDYQQLYNQLQQQHKELQQEYEEYKSNFLIPPINSKKKKYKI